jgi:hypothetical protein
MQWPIHLNSGLKNISSTCKLGYCESKNNCTETGAYFVTEVIAELALYEVGFRSIFALYFFGFRWFLLHVNARQQILALQKNNLLYNSLYSFCEKIFFWLPKIGASV